MTYRSSRRHRFGTRLELLPHFDWSRGLRVDDPGQRRIVVMDAVWGSEQGLASRVARPFNFSGHGARGYHPVITCPVGTARREPHLDAVLQVDPLALLDLERAIPELGGAGSASPLMIPAAQVGVAVRYPAHIEAGLRRQPDPSAAHIDLSHL